MGSNITQNVILSSTGNNEINTTVLPVSITHTQHPCPSSASVSLNSHQHSPQISTSIHTPGPGQDLLTTYESLISTNITSTSISILHSSFAADCVLYVAILLIYSSCCILLLCTFIRKRKLKSSRDNYIVFEVTSTHQMMFIHV